MRIRNYKSEDIDNCAKLLIEAYNGEPWQNRWTEETAKRYLEEICCNARFAGFIICDGEDIAGAAFCREKTWWTNDELYVDEFYISPRFQRQGWGQMLLKTIEDHVRAKKLAGITLLTSRHMPAAGFYKKNGFIEAAHVMFMYKEI